MKKVLIFPLLTLILSLCAYSQCEKLAKESNEAMKPFLASGQYLRKAIKDGEVVTLKTTLFEGFRYRVVALTDNNTGGKVLYRLVDGGRNTIFSNKEIINSKYWDFEVGSTDNFVIQAKLTAGAGCVILSIGFDDSALGNDDDDAEGLDDLDEDMDDLLDDLDDLDDLDIDDDLDLDDDLDMDLDDPIFEDEDDFLDDD